MLKRSLLASAFVAFFAPYAQATTVSVINGHHDITQHRSGGLQPLDYTINLFAHQPDGWDAALSLGNTVIVEQRGVEGSDVEAVRQYLSDGGRIVLLGDDHAWTVNFYNQVFGAQINISAPADATTWLQTSAVADTEFADDVDVLEFINSAFPVPTALATGSTVFYEGDTGAQVFRSTFGAGDLFYIGWDFCCGGTPETYADYYQVLESAIHFGGGPDWTPQSTSIPAVPVPAGLPFLLAGLAALGMVAGRKHRVI